MSYLKEELFRVIVEHTPLVAVDFIITNGAGGVLLGRRNSSPAKGMWCVPGGRVLKGEAIEAAVKRKLDEELGIKEAHPMNFMGLYEHFYEDSAVNSKISIHYLTIAFQFELDPAHVIKACDQHESFIFFDINDALASDEVPRYMKNYLCGDFKPYLNLNLL